MEEQRTFRIVLNRTTDVEQEFLTDVYLLKNLLIQQVQENNSTFYGTEGN